jgi:CubicO group peptidase (beta-lactamase class C family)
MVSGCVSQTPVSPSPTVPVIPTLSAEAQLVSQIDKGVTSLVEQDRFSGSVLVARDGKVLLSKGYGMANIELGVPNTPQTKFRLASITKQFTAMAILQLQQQGKLNVQDPICQHIQDCPEAWQPITIQHLLTHTSGIHDYTGDADSLTARKQTFTPAKIIALFYDLPLDFTPGTTFSYSNSGYIVLGQIIEQVSGESYATFLQENIFGPLQMLSTGYDNNRTVIMDRASGYTSSTANADYVDMSYPYAAGGLYSTVEDLFKWDQALYTEKLILKPLRDEMFTPIVPIPKCIQSCYDIGYGYGWIIANRFDQPLVWHNGSIEGFSTEIDRYPEANVTIIILSNRQNINVSSISSTISQLIFAGK